MTQTYFTSDGSDSKTPNSVTLFENSPIEKDCKKADILSLPSLTSVEEDPVFVDSPDIRDEEE